MPSWSGSATIITLVKDGLHSTDAWIKRKAILLHSTLIDEASERKRFVESVLADDKFEMIAASMVRVQKLEDEVLEFEMKEGKDYTLVAMSAG